MIAAGLRLRHPADRWAMLWLAAAIAVAATSWSTPAWRPWLLPLGGYFSFAAGLIAHAHNHRRMLVGARANQALDLVLTLFFGFPTLVWVAGHNRWHHRYNNDPRDPSAGWRLFRGHHLVSAAVTPVFVMVYEPVVWPFLVDAWRHDRARLRFYGLQLAVYVGAIVAGLAVDATAFLWAFALPWAIGLYLIHFANYIQHVHCDPSTRFAHSRDWTGRALNALTFNQGFHTIHHNWPAVHWSQWRRVHMQVRDRIPAELQSSNLAWWCLRQYLLAPLVPRLGTRQVGRPAWEANRASRLALDDAPAALLDGRDEARGRAAAHPPKGRDVSNARSRRP